MTIEADLNGKRKVRTKFDEQWAEVFIQQVEIVMVRQGRATADPGIRCSGFGIPLMNRPENRGFFLSLANIQHPFGKRGAPQVFLGNVILALVFIEGNQINLLLGKLLDGMNKMRNRQG